MKSLQFLRSQGLQQFARTRQLGTTLQRPGLPNSSSLRTASLHSPQLRSLHTKFRSPFSRLRTYNYTLRAATRTFATATETSTQHLSLSQRLKKLSREYGWSALGVYMLLSAADFPFCFLAVRLMGTDRIGHWEHVILSKIKETVKWPFNSDTQEAIDGAIHEVGSVVQKRIPVDQLEGHSEKRMLEESETYIVIDHGYKQANEASKKSDASIWTQLALAYAIHKSFIFIRVPLTVAVTPKVVKTLRSWGWNIGKMPTKKVTAGNTSSAVSGVNTKGSGIKKD